ALIAFLAQIQSLSLLEQRSLQIWAGGWHWPDVQGGQLSYEDVSVIQRGYRDSSWGKRPGFSLDPRSNETVEDVLAGAPGVGPGLAQLVIEKERKRLPGQSNSGFLPSPQLVVPTRPPLPPLPGFQDVPAPSPSTADDLEAALEDGLYDGKMQPG